MDAYRRMEIYADVDETNSADRFRKRFILGSHQRLKTPIVEVDGGWMGGAEGGPLNATRPNDFIANTFRGFQG